MRNTYSDVGLTLMFASLLFMATQEAFEFAYGIAAGVIIFGIGLHKEKNK